MSGNGEHVGLAIQAAIERALLHEAMTPGKLRVHVTTYHDNPVDMVLTIAAYFLDQEAMLDETRGRIRVPLADLDARAGELVQLVDAAVADATDAAGISANA